MKNLKKIILIGIALLVCLIIYENKTYATTYYVSADGKSTNSGTEEGAPIDLDTAKNKTFKSGDKVYFKRGDVFNDTFYFHVSGSQDNEVEFGAYGNEELPLPIFTTARYIEENASWTKVSGYSNIWKYTLANASGYNKYDSNDKTYDIPTLKEGIGNVGFLRDENNVI